MRKNTAYLSLGSNLSKEQNLPAAARFLASHGRLLAVSTVYETEPIGNPDDPSFLNAAVILETALSAVELKEQVLRPLEQSLGRARTSDPNAPRSIDVDICLFNHDILDLGRRHIPDPEILLHPHVAVPLAQVAPDYLHPETGESLAEIARRVKSQSSQSLIPRWDVVLQPA